MHIGWRWLALNLLHPLPGPDEPPPPAPSGREGPELPAGDLETEAAHHARWVAAFAIGRTREGGDSSVDGEVAEGDVAQVLDLAVCDAVILRLAIGHVEELATLEQPTQTRARALLLRSLARVEDPDSVC